MKFAQPRGQFRRFLLLAFLLASSASFVCAQSRNSVTSASNSSSGVQTIHPAPTPVSGGGQQPPTIQPVPTPISSPTPPIIIQPTPTPPPPPESDGESDWKNAGGTDWNTGANWTAVSGSAPPVAGDVAWFKTAFSSGQPNLSAATSIAGFYFSGAGSSGYDITSSSGAVAFTLTGASTSSGALAENSDATANAIRADNTSGTNTIDAPIILGAAVPQAFVQAAGGTLVVSGVVSSTSAVTLSIDGGGTVRLSGANTYTGATTINGSGSTLEVANDGSTTHGRIASAATITVNTGGTLLLSGSGSADRINDLAGISLAGGTLAKGSGVNEGSTSAVGMGALTLTATGSKIDFTGTAGTLTFASFVTNSNVLSIVNYVGTGSPGGTDQLIFNQDESTKLNNFDFGSGAGVSVAELDLTGGFFEVYSTLAVPEPSTWVAAALALGAVAYTQRKRFARNRRIEAKTPV